MEPERWQQINDLFQSATERAPEERAAFLDQACHGDEGMCREVESLIASYERAENFIESPAFEVAPELLTNDRAGALVGELIGHYRVESLIGVGGMGVVYLARRADEQYEKLVAIKLIKRGMDTDSVLRHFRNERQILASFDHPNIARLFDGATTKSGLPYFVMEYVEGLPIDQYCDTYRLSVTERLELFRDVCAAVTYAHRHTVIHRDIKPSNILVTSDGAPKLLDFGIAKILQPGGRAEALATLTALRLMTPEYASPEQVRGQPLTTATDVYSLGAVLYQLLTGQRPYRLKTGTPEEISRAIIEQEPPRPSSALARSTSANLQSAIQNPQLLRGDLDNIVLMAIRKEPERRYQSVEQFSEDVRRHLQVRPVLARKDTIGYRAGKFVRRNRAVTVAAALVFLTLLGGIIATTWQAHRARVQEAAAKAEKARAERRFNDVRQLAHSVLFDYHDAIKDLPGATPVRERLVKDALVYLDSLASEAGGDSALQRELAAAYERVGDVRGGAYSASLGDRAGAMESYLKALRIREARVAADPNDVQSRRDLAGSYAKIGNQMIETSEAARGLQYLRKAFSVYLEATAERPKNSEIRYDLAGICNDLGLALEDWGDASGALENHRKALPIREELVAADPSSQMHRRNLSVTYVNMGRALVLSGDIKGGLESNQKGLALRAALFADNPTNADYRRLLAISYQNDGDYRAILHDIGGALESFRKKLVFDEQSLADDPVNAQSRGDFRYSCERIGVLLAESGDYSQALSYHREALAMGKKLSVDAPQDLILRYRLIVTHASIGEMQAKLGERAVALADCSKATALLNQMAEDPANALRSSLRAQAYTHLAEAYAALATFKKVATIEQREHWRAARNMYGRSLDIWQGMQKRGILTGEDAAKPQEVAREIAKCDASLTK